MSDFVPFNVSEWMQELQEPALQMRALQSIFSKLHQLSNSDWSILLPELVTPMKSGTGEVLALLVENAVGMAKLMSNFALHKHLLPVLVRALQSGPTRLQELALQAGLRLSDRLNHEQMVEVLLPQLQALMLQTTNVGVRTSAQRLLHICTHGRNMVDISIQDERGAGASSRDGMSSRRGSRENERRAQSADRPGRNLSPGPSSHGPRRPSPSRSQSHGHASFLPAPPDEHKYGRQDRDRKTYWDEGEGSHVRSSHDQSGPQPWRRDSDNSHGGEWEQGLKMGAVRDGARDGVRDVGKRQGWKDHDQGDLGYEKGRIYADERKMGPEYDPKRPQDRDVGRQQDRKGPYNGGVGMDYDRRGGYEYGGSSGDQGKRGYRDPISDLDAEGKPPRRAEEAGRDDGQSGRKPLVTMSGRENPDYNRPSKWEEPRGDSRDPRQGPRGPDPYGRQNFKEEGWAPRGPRQPDPGDGGPVGRAPQDPRGPQQQRGLDPRNRSSDRERDQNFDRDDLGGQRGRAYKGYGGEFENRDKGLGTVVEPPRQVGNRQFERGRYEDSRSFRGPGYGQGGYPNDPPWEPQDRRYRDERGQQGPRRGGLAPGQGRRYSTPTRGGPQSPGRHPEGKWEGGMEPRGIAPSRNGREGSPARGPSRSQISSGGGDAEQYERWQKGPVQSSSKDPPRRASPRGRREDERDHGDQDEVREQGFVDTQRAGYRRELTDPNDLRRDRADNDPGRERVDSEPRRDRPDWRASRGPGPVERRSTDRLGSEGPKRDDFSQGSGNRSRTQSPTAMRASRLESPGTSHRTRPSPLRSTSRNASPLHTQPSPLSSKSTGLNAQAIEPKHEHGIHSRYDSHDRKWPAASQPQSWHQPKAKYPHSDLEPSMGTHVRSRSGLSTPGNEPEAIDRRSPPGPSLANMSAPSTSAPSSALSAHAQFGSGNAEGSTAAAPGRGKFMDRRSPSRPAAGHDEPSHSTRLFAQAVPIKGRTPLSGRLSGTSPESDDFPSQPPPPPPSDHPESLPSQGPQTSKLSPSPLFSTRLPSSVPSTHSPSSTDIGVVGSPGVWIPPPAPLPPEVAPFVPTDYARKLPTYGFISSHDVASWMAAESAHGPEQGTPNALPDAPDLSSSSDSPAASQHLAESFQRLRELCRPAVKPAEVLDTLWKSVAQEFDEYRPTSIFVPQPPPVGLMQDGGWGSPSTPPVSAQAQDPLDSFANGTVDMAWHLEEGRPAPPDPRLRAGLSKRAGQSPLRPTPLLGIPDWAISAAFDREGGLDFLLKAGPSPVSAAASAPPPVLDPTQGRWQLPPTLWATAGSTVEGRAMYHSMEELRAELGRGGLPKGVCAKRVEDELCLPVTQEVITLADLKHGTQFVPASSEALKHDPLESTLTAVRGLLSARARRTMLADKELESWLEATYSAGAQLARESAGVCRKHDGVTRLKRKYGVDRMANLASQERRSSNEGVQGNGTSSKREPPLKVEGDTGRRAVDACLSERELARRSPAAGEHLHECASASVHTAHLTEGSRRSEAPKAVAQEHRALVVSSSSQQQDLQQHPHMHSSQLQGSWRDMGVGSSQQDGLRQQTGASGCRQQDEQQATTMQIDPPEVDQSQGGDIRSEPAEVAGSRGSLAQDQVSLEHMAVDPHDATDAGRSKPEYQTKPEGLICTGAQEFIHGAEVSSAMNGIGLDKAHHGKLEGVILKNLNGCNYPGTAVLAGAAAALEPAAAAAAGGPNLTQSPGEGTMAANVSSDEPPSSRPPDSLHLTEPSCSKTMTDLQVLDSYLHTLLARLSRRQGTHAETAAEDVEEWLGGWSCDAARAELHSRRHEIARRRLQQREAALPPKHSTSWDPTPPPQHSALLRFDLAVALISHDLRTVANVAITRALDSLWEEHDAEQRRLQQLLEPSPPSKPLPAKHEPIKTTLLESPDSPEPSSPVAQSTPTPPRISRPNPPSGGGSVLKRSRVAADEERAEGESPGVKRRLEGGALGRPVPRDIKGLGHVGPARTVAADVANSAASVAPPENSKVVEDIMRKVLAQLQRYDHEVCEDAFAEPVTEDIAKGYFDTIKQPMDLFTIKEKLESKSYKADKSGLDAMCSDVELICANCMKFNPECNVFHTLGKEFLDYSRKVFAKSRKTLTALEPSKGSV